MGQARNHTLPDRIADSAHDDRDGLRGPLRLECGLGAPGEKEVNLEGHEVLGQLTEPLVAPFRVPILVADILVLDVAELSESLPERIDWWERLDGQDPDRRDLPGRLRVDGDRCEKAECENDHKPDPPHRHLVRMAGGSLADDGGSHEMAALVNHRRRAD